MFSLSIIIGIVFIVLIIKLRENKAIKAVSWKLNIVSIIGSIILSITQILFGIDENMQSYTENDDKFTFLCNFRTWLLAISFTLLFMPLFLKTYRIGQIFRVTNDLRVKDITDTKLVYATLCCVLTDIIILFIFVLIDPLSRQYQDSGNAETIDALQQVQHTYGLCNCNDYASFLAIFSVWKVTQLLFGCYAAMTVTQVKSFFSIHFLVEIKFALV